jgi:hypothetical protein
MSNETIPPEGSRGSPWPGCIILVTILVVFGGLAVLYAVVGTYQNRVIGEFTAPAAVDLTIPAPSASEAEAAVSKLQSIATAARDNRAERVLFTAAELNTLIVTLPALADFRGTTRIEAITSEGISAAMSQPMRKGILAKGRRYLNASFLFQPELRTRTVAFKVLSITSVEGVLPEGFVRNYAMLDFFKLDPELPAIRDSILSLGAVYCEDGQLVVETKIRELLPTENSALRSSVPQP